MMMMMMMMMMIHRFSTDLPQLYCRILWPSEVTLTVLTVQVG